MRGYFPLIPKASAGQPIAERTEHHADGERREQHAHDARDDAGAADADHPRDRSGG